MISPFIIHGGAVPAKLNNSMQYETNVQVTSINNVPLLLI